MKERTVVLTLSKGSRASYADFSPILDQYEGKFEAFGTVGVGHIWHLTFKSIQDSDMFQRVHSRFTICNNEVSVLASKYLDTLNVATIYWLPYWVPHEDVVLSLAKYTGTRSFCRYVQIPQKGYRGCYSTQRRIESPVGLKELPYFFNIESEGVSHRVFLFVPGREPICFKCKRAGHMRSSCKGDSDEVMDQEHSVDNLGLVVQDLAVSRVSQTPLEASSPSVRPEVQKEEVVAPSESAEDCDEALDSIPDKDLFIYRIRETRRNGSLRTVMLGGAKMFDINPPTASTVDDDVYEHAISRCDSSKCYLIRLWEDEIISHARMKYHFDQCHSGKYSLEKSVSTD